MIEIHFSGSFKFDLQGGSYSRSLMLRDQTELAFASEEISKMLHEILSVALLVGTKEDEDVLVLENVILKVLAATAVRLQPRTEAQLAFVKAAQDVAGQG